MKKTLLSNYDNSWYHRGSTIKLILWNLINILFFLNPISVYSPLKVWLLRVFGARIGRNVIIKPQVNIKHPWLLIIHDHVWIGENVWIDNLAQVTLCSNTCISQGALLLTGNHNYKSTSFDLIIGSITLEEGSWIGAKAVVCPGVSCGSHSILTVGSVATKDLKSYSIYQGNPAVKIRSRYIHY